MENNVNISFNNSTTSSYDEKPQGLYMVYNIVIALVTVVAMFSMGSAMTFSDVKMILRKPVGPCIGMVCQIIILPAACFGYAVALKMEANLGIGMVLTGSCPGGTVSGIVAFWAKADTSMSVCMTTISTTLAVGTLPLNMFIYSRYWVDDMTQIPYLNMVITVIYVWLSVVTGYFVGRRWPKAVPYVTKIGTIIALALMLTGALIQGKLYPELFDLGWEAYLASITMPIIGFVIGFFLAFLFCQGHPQRLAIGLETSLQNTALALTVIAISFPSSTDSSYFSQFTLLYTTFQLVLAGGVIVVVWLYGLCRYGETPCMIKAHSELQGEESNEQKNAEDTFKSKIAGEESKDFQMYVACITSNPGTKSEEAQTNTTYYDNMATSTPF